MSVSVSVSWNASFIQRRQHLLHASTTVTVTLAYCLESQLTHSPRNLPCVSTPLFSVFQSVFYPALQYRRVVDSLRANLTSLCRPLYLEAETSLLTVSRYPLASQFEYTTVRQTDRQTDTEQTHYRFPLDAAGARPGAL